MRFKDNKIAEIQGEKNNGKIPQKYLDVVTHYITLTQYELTENTQKKLKNAKDLQNTISKIKEKISEYNKYDYEHILPKLGIETKKDPQDGMLILSHFSKPANDISFAEIGIKENHLFKFIKEIKGNADFHDTEVTHLGNLEKIGKNADFQYSRVLDTGKLSSIGKNVYIKNSNLRKENFANITTQSLLKEKLKKYGKKSYETILPELGITTEKDSTDGMLILSHYAQPQGDDISSILLSSVIDENDLFKKVKSIKGNANFRNSEVVNLGNLTTIDGDAIFFNSNVENLGKLAKIGGYAVFQNSRIIDLGNLAIIGKDANFFESNVIKLGELTTILKNAIFQHSKISNLGKLTTIGNDAYFEYSNIDKLGNLKEIGGKINIKNSKLTKSDFDDIKHKPQMLVY